MEQERENGEEINYFETDALFTLYKRGPMKTGQLVFIIDHHTNAPTNMVIMYAQQMIPEMREKGMIQYDDEKEIIEITPEGISKLIKISKSGKILPEIIDKEFRETFIIN